jgi:hypothetical protein
MIEFSGLLGSVMVPFSLETSKIAVVKLRLSDRFHLTPISLFSNSSGASACEVIDNDKN